MKTNQKLAVMDHALHRSLASRMMLGRDSAACDFDSYEGTYQTFVVDTIIQYRLYIFILKVLHNQFPPPFAWYRSRLSKRGSMDAVSIRCLQARRNLLLAECHDLEQEIVSMEKLQKEIRSSCGDLTSAKRM